MAKGLTVTAVNTYKELLKSDFKKAKKMLEDLAQDARLAIMWEIAQESNIVTLARREKELEKELSDVQDKMKKFTDNHYYNNWKIVLDKKTDQRMQERFKVFFALAELQEAQERIISLATAPAPILEMFDGLQAKFEKLAEEVKIVMKGYSRPPIPSDVLKFLGEKNND